MGTVTTVQEFTFHPARGAAAVVLFEQALPKIAAFDGCVSAVVARNRADPNTLLLIATWDALERYEEYREWRLADGRLPELEQLAVTLVRPLRETVGDTLVAV